MRISKVVSAKPGELIVEDNDGNKIRRKGGTVAWRCNNPGNIKNGSFARSMGSVGQDAGGHAVFETKEHGFQAQFVLLFDSGHAYWNLTLADAIAKYAPVGDASNEPPRYQAYITKKTGIPGDKKLKTLSHQEKFAMLDAMSVYEGYKEGKDTKIK